MQLAMRALGPVISACLVASGGNAGDEPLTTELVTNGLVRPVFVTYAPGDATRLFILEQRDGTTGRIRIFDLTTDTLLPASFLEVSDVNVNSEQGLLGMAFHPDFESNGYFYVNYTTSVGSSRTVIERYHVPSGTPNVADAGSAHLILEIPQPHTNHNAGWLGFSPVDGYLYIPTGDGGSFCDPVELAQDNTNNLLGKVLRIDVDNDGFPGDPNRNYAIPEDNPYTDGPEDDEIWSYGLRNPYRCSFDRQTGDLWIGDVGQQFWEEVNFQPFDSAGEENYGWDCREGTSCAYEVSFLCNEFDNGCNCGDSGFTDPIQQYDHTPGHQAITGGYVYRGCAIPWLQGAYFYADYGTGTIWSLRYDGASVSDWQDRTAELEPAGALTISNPSSFGEDAYGELYICDLFAGEVYKIVPANAPPDENNNGVSDDCETVGDTNGDDTVGILDLLAVLGGWGPCDAPCPPNCPEDVNNDCVVGIQDLLMILDNWG